MVLSVHWAKEVAQAVANKGVVATCFTVIDPSTLTVLTHEKIFIAFPLP